MKDCTNCKHKECWEYADPCDSCTDIDHTGNPKNWEAQTHADRIRAKSDEELADWIAQILTYHNVKMYVECEKACPLYKCCNNQPYDNIENWLKSPVEEGER